MGSITFHPDTSLGPRDALEVRVGDGVIYTLTPGVPVMIPPEHQAAVQTAIARSAALLALAAPAQPAVLTGAGASGGATTWTYTVVASNDQGDSQQSPTRSTAAGLATLTSGNKVTIPFPAAQAGQLNWKVIRTVAGGTPATTGIIGTVAVAATSFDDTGIAATAYSSALLAGTATANTGTGGGVGITDSGQAWTTTGQGMKGFTITMATKTLVVLSNDATHLNGAGWYTAAGLPTTPPSAGAYTIAPNTFFAPFGPAEM